MYSLLPAFLSFQSKFELNFIKDDRYMYMVRGLSVTLQVTLFSALIGIILGFFISIVRSTHDMSDKPKSASARIILNILDGICRVYLAIIRGTPTMVQILICYLIILKSVDNKIIVAVTAFGLNSAAYVAEIFRAGILSIDKGQFEAGRSLGFNYPQTMVYVIMPQAFKNVLPALGNEIIVLLKETAISGYIALQDLTKSVDIIRSQTFDPTMPLLAAALIYFLIVMLMAAGVSALERRLRDSGH